MTQGGNTLILNKMFQIMTTFGGGSPLQLVLFIGLLSAFLSINVRSLWDRNKPLKIIVFHEIFSKEFHASK